MYEDPDWRTPMRNFQRTAFCPRGFSPPLRLAWRFGLDDYVWASPVIARGIVYFPGPGTGLYALRVDDGSVLWRDEKFIKSGQNSATVWEDTVIVCGKESLNTYDAFTGELRGRIDAKCGHTSPCIHRGIVYWGLTQGLAAAELGSSSLKWVRETTSVTRTIPSAREGIVVFSSIKSAYAVDSETGAVRWCWSTDKHQAVIHPLAAIHGNLVLISVSGLGLVGLDLDTGQEELHLQYGGGTSPAIDEERDVVYVADLRLHAISLPERNIAWSTEKFAFGTSAPIIVGDHVFIGGGVWRFVYGFDKYTGEKSWEYATGDLVFSTPAYADGRLVIGCHDGYIYCFKGADR